MFTWGLFLSNFSLAMTTPGEAGPGVGFSRGKKKVLRPASMRLKDQQKSPGRTPGGQPSPVEMPLLGRGVVAELHGVGGSSLALAAQIGRIPEHGGERYLSLDGLHSARPRRHPLDLPLAGVQVANNVPHE